MLNDYESQISAISEMYSQANRLIIWYETHSKIGNLSFTYELKDAFNHIMDAISADLKMKAEKDPEIIKKCGEEIVSELEGCRKHLFRLIFDVGETYCIRVLEKAVKIFDRYPKRLATKVYPNFNDEFRKKYLDFLDRLSNLKEEKSVSSHKSLSDKMFALATDVKEFVTKGLTKKEGYKWSIFWMVLAWTGSIIFTTAVGSVITYFLTKLIGA